MLVVLDLPTTVPVGTTLSCLHSVGAEAADRASAEYPHTPVLAQYHQRRGIAAARPLIHSVTLALSLSRSLLQGMAGGSETESVIVVCRVDRLDRRGS